jgi:cell division protein FtsQ
VLVSGNTLVPAEEVAQALSVGEANLFSLRARRLETRIEAHPAVHTAHVRLLLPNSILVSIEERVPVAVWNSGAQQFLVAEDGLLFREGSGPLPSIYAPSLPNARVSDRVDASTIGVARNIASRLDSLGISDARLEYEPNGGISLVGSEPPRVALGSGDRLEARLEAYQRIRRYLAETGNPAGLIDVRFLERPYFR